MRKEQYITIIESINPEHFGALIPNEGICKHIGATLFKKNGEMYRTPPVFREKPLASCFQRLFDWEFSGGNLGAVFSTGMDIDLIIRAVDESNKGKLGDYWTNKKSNLLNEGIWVKDTQMTRKQLETLVTFIAKAIRGGKQTPARSAWQHAIYG